MPAGGAIGGGLAAGGLSAIGSIGSAIIGSNAATQASQEQQQMDMLALETQIAGENASLQEQAPFVDIGTGAAKDLANLYGISYAASGNGAASVSPTGVVTPANSNAASSSAGGQAAINAAQTQFTNSPDYNFAFDQGLQALDRSAAASGTLASGGQTKAAEEFGQGLASQQYSNYFARLMSLANMGQSSANNSSATLTGSANAQAGTLTGTGTAQAAGTIGSASALAGGLNGLSSSTLAGLLGSKLGGTSNSAYQTLDSTNTALASIQTPNYVIDTSGLPGLS